MNKRLRKKKRVGEYSEYGALWEVKLKEHLEQEALEAFMDRIIEDWYEKRIWLGGGGRVGKSEYSPRIGGYTYAMNKKGQTFITLNKQNLIEIGSYLKLQPEVATVLIGSLRDMNHMWNKHGHRVTTWWKKDEEWDDFHIKADELLGPDGPRCCVGGYIWHGLDGKQGCSRCNKPYNG